VGARILLVEDDNAIGRGVVQALETSGHEVDWVTSGTAALASAATALPALVLLDLGLPDMDGVQVCAELRSAHPFVTIVILTARTEEIDVVVGLDAGADDYLTKPFRLSELLARVRAHLRRPRLAASDENDELVLGDLVIDSAARRVVLAGAELELRPKEFALLAMLAGNAGRAVTREAIMSEVWDEHWFGSTKTLDMHISSLRRKLGERDGGPSRITTLRGVGYRLERP
jgi:DNA-binding response OmpR family regulator